MPSLFDSDDDEATLFDDDHELSVEEQLRLRIGELEVLLASERARSEALEARLAAYEGVAPARRRKVERADDDDWTGRAPSIRRRPRLGGATGRPRPLAKERLKKRVPEPSNDQEPSNGQEPSNDDVATRASEAVRAWAKAKTLVEMLSSLADVLPPELAQGLDTVGQDDAKAVRRAYLQVARRCHPDRLAGAKLPMDARYRASFVFAAVTDAYRHDVEED